MRLNKKNILIPLFFIVSSSLFAQTFKTDISKILANRKVMIYSKDTVFEFEIVSSDVRKKVSNKNYYAWYKQKEIWYTQGVYDGNLLDGIFKKYDPDHQLRAKGYYKLGLKHRKWYYLDKNGTLIKYEIWKNGKLYKPFSISQINIFKKKTKVKDVAKDENKAKSKKSTNFIPKRISSDSIKSINETNFVDPK
jgi:hypothetical protein